MYLVRPDAAQVASVEVTTDKARTAAIYRRPSKDFEDQASGGRPSALHLARAVPLQGGMPIDARRRGHRRDRRERRDRRPTRTSELAEIGAAALERARSRPRARTAPRSSPPRPWCEKFQAGGLLLDEPGYKIDAGRRDAPGRGRVPRARGRRDARRRGHRDRRHRRRDASIRARWHPASCGPPRSRAARPTSSREGDVLAIPQRRAAPVHRRLGPVPVLRGQGGGVMAAATTPLRPPLARPARAAARPARRDRRPADRRGRRARRRPVALLRRPGRGDRLRRARRSGRSPTRSARATVPNRTYDVAAARRGGRLRRLGLAAADAAATRCAGSRNGRVCFNWYRTRSRSPSGSATSTRPARPSSSRWWSTTTPRSGSTARCRCALGDTGGPVVGRVQRAEPRRPHARRAARASASRSPCSASTARSRRRRATTSGCARATLDVYAPDRAAAASTAELEVERIDARLDALVRRTRRSSGSPAASSSPRGRCGRPTARCCSARRTRTRSTGSIPSWARSTVFRPKSGYTGVDIGRYHQPGSNGLDVRPRRAG